MERVQELIYQTIGNVLRSKFDCYDATLCIWKPVNANCSEFVYNAVYKDKPIGTLFVITLPLKSAFKKERKSFGRKGHIPYLAGFINNVEDNTVSYYVFEFELQYPVPAVSKFAEAMYEKVTSEYSDWKHYIAKELSDDEVIDAYINFMHNGDKYKGMNFLQEHYGIQTCSIVQGIKTDCPLVLILLNKSKES